MEIVKAIKLSLDNIKKIVECPVVYRISKMEIDPLMNDDANLRKIEAPHICVFVQGFKLPCPLNGCSYLAQDTNGYWRYLAETELVSLQAKS